MNEHSPLSERELEILGLLATGASNRQIAQALTISANTVKVHLRNIYEKIDVASRTEATIYALREGLVEIEGVSAVGNEETEISQAPTKPRPSLLFWILPLITVLTLGAFLWFVLRNPSSSNSGILEPAPAASRWQQHSPLPSARAALAVAAYDAHIYAIGGETHDGVSTAVDRYDPQLDQWESLPQKPLGVSEIQAAVVGGKIYVPGGKLESGNVTDIVEVFDPEDETWEQAASLPQPRSAYALASYEGRLYLFGGWDGEQFSDDVYSFDPQTNTWQRRIDMPGPRGFTAAATTEDKIYIFGGFDGTEIFDSTWVYTPNFEDSPGQPWSEDVSMPYPCYAISAATLVDAIYIIGGSEINPEEAFLQFIPGKAEWRSTTIQNQSIGHSIGLAALETQVHILGGLTIDGYSDQHYSYQAIYTLNLPIVQ